MTAGLPDSGRSGAPAGVSRAGSNGYHADRPAGLRHCRPPLSAIAGSGSPSVVGVVRPDELKDGSRKLTSHSTARGRPCAFGATRGVFFERRRAALALLEAPAHANVIFDVPESREIVMPTRRKFLQQASYSLVLLGGARWLVSEVEPRAASPRLRRPRATISMATVGLVLAPATRANRANPRRRLPHRRHHRHHREGAEERRSSPTFGTAPSGVTPTYFNTGALLFWENKGGDWTDALGVKQGSDCVRSGGSGSVGPFTMDVTSLAKWLHANSSYGMFLKVTGGRMGRHARKRRSGAAPGADRYRHQGSHTRLSRVQPAR